MVLRGVQYCFLITLLAVACISAKSDDAEWFGNDDDSSTPSTTTRANRRTTTPWDFIPRTRKSTKLPPNAADVITRSTTTAPSAFTPTNFTDTIITLLKNFAKFVTREEGAENDEYLADVLRLEFFTVATGNHFVTSPNVDDKVEQKQQKRAAAMTALWLDLFCTEDIDTILNNATRDTVVKGRSARRPMTTNTMEEILQTLFDKLNDAIEEDSFLATMYTAEQIRYAVRLLGSTAEQRVYIPFSDVTQGRVDASMLETWVSDLQIRKFLIHRQFLDMRKEVRRGVNSEDDVNNNIWVRSILKVARERCCMDKVQKIYTAALNETAANNFATNDFPHQPIRMFVDKLTEAIEADDALKSEWIKQKNNVREKLRIPKSEHRRVNLGVISPT